MRFIADLAYAGDITSALPNDAFIGELVREKFLYYPAVTREAFAHRGRLTGLMGQGRIAADLGLAPVDAVDDRMMICGSPEFLGDITALLRDWGFAEGSSSSPSTYVIEKAFVER